ncbi:MAG: hypothetical protein BMS9Abin11_1404 [Gammaproteobacteria bacterium]|nr:MAG: hypothetical protein BMS9Abin11_1404 [Gammaproteobacteria bacterium]
MDQTTANKWKSEVLDVIFEALAESNQLVDCLVFKGARVLNKRLDSFARQSLDIDANLLSGFVEENPDFTEQKKFLEEEISRSITKHFEKQSPVRFELTRIKIVLNPPRKHPLGWTAFTVTISINDLANVSVRGLPSLKIDLAAPEELGDESISSLNIGGYKVKAYTIERIAGEKLRAFLSSLPSYRKKLKKPGEAVRAKDIYDIARIVSQYPISDNQFWKKTGNEFRRACKSRFIDCSGIETFEEDLHVTKETYEKDAALPKDISFERAWGSLTKIISLFEEKEAIPFENPLPDK